MYSLDDAVRQFKDQGLVSRREYFRQPLLGAVDGANKRFTGQFTPWDSATAPTVYDADGAPVAASDFAVSYPEGAITFMVAPAQGTALLADYDYIENNDTVLRAITLDGFDELVFRLGCTWTLRANGEGVPEVVDQNGDDPMVNDSTFSADRQALRAFSLACYYAYVRRQAGYTAQHNRSLRSGDIAINTSQNPQDLWRLMRSVERDLERACGALVLPDADLAGESGYYIGPLTSQAYEKWFRWQGKSTIALDGEE